ncbi:hypothetical protein Agub_g7504, partial [Astrephomene gubernaculifera]
MAPRSFHPTVRWDPTVDSYLTSCLGPSRLAAISAALARPARHTCLRVNTQRAKPEDVVRQLRDMQRQREWQQRQQGEQQQQQQQRLRAPPPPPRLHPHIPTAVVLSGSGPWDVEYDEGMPEVVVNRFAAEAVLKGAHVYAPGLLAASPGIKEGDLVAVSAELERPVGHQQQEQQRWATGISRGAAVSPDGCVTLSWTRQQQHPGQTKQQKEHLKQQQKQGSQQQGCLSRAVRDAGTCTDGSCASAESGGGVASSGESCDNSLNSVTVARDMSGNGSIAGNDRDEDSTSTSSCNDSDVSSHPCCSRSSSVFNGSRSSSDLDSCSSSSRGSDGRSSGGGRDGGPAAGVSRPCERVYLGV